MKRSLRSILLGGAVIAALGSPALVVAPFAQDAAPAETTMAAGLTQADVDALLKGLPEGVTATYGSVTEDAAAGATTIEGLKFVQADTTIEIAKAVVTGVDKDAFARAFDPARYGAAPEEDFRTMASKIRFEGVTATHQGKQVFKADGLDVEGWRMKQFAFKPGDTSAMKPDDAAKAFQAIGAFLDALQVDRLAAQGLAIDAAIPAMAGQPAQTLVYAFESIEQSGIDRGRFGPGTMTNAAGKSSVEGQAGMPGFAFDFSVGKITSEYADFSKVVPWMVKGELPPTSERDLISIGRFAYENYLVEMAGIGKLNFPSLSTEPLPFVWLIPDDFSFEGQGTFEPAAADAFLGGPQIRSYFEDSSTAMLRFGWAYDETAGTTEITTYAFGLGGWGEFDFGVKVGGLKLDDIPTLATRAAELLSLDGAFVRWDDDGGFDKGLQIAAEQSKGPDGSGPTPQDLKSMITMQVNGATSAPPFAGVAAIESMAKAINDFVAAPGTIEFRLAPPQPLKQAELMGLMGAMADPAKAIETTGASITYQP